MNFYSAGFALKINDFIGFVRRLQIGCISLCYFHYNHHSDPHVHYPFLLVGHLCPVSPNALGTNG
jgi:hypothetical protein